MSASADGRYGCLCSLTGAFHIKHEAFIWRARRWCVSGTWRPCFSGSIWNVSVTMMLKSANSPFINFSRLVRQVENGYAEEEMQQTSGPTAAAAGPCWHDMYFHFRRGWKEERGKEEQNAGGWRTDAVGRRFVRNLNRDSGRSAWLFFFRI